MAVPSFRAIRSRIEGLFGRWVRVVVCNLEEASSHKTMRLRPAVAADLPLIVDLERMPMARTFVGQWSEERHRATISDGDGRYYVGETGSGDIEAYSILRGVSEDSRAMELKRIVVGVPESGLGRKILEELVRIPFEEFHAHRLFLDVYEDNARATSL
jgi:diamine N-acetyltransferase